MHHPKLVLSKEDQATMLKELEEAVTKEDQIFLQELETALLALPQKRLIRFDLERDGEVCALGAVALKRYIDAGRPGDMKEAFKIRGSGYTLTDRTAEKFGISFNLTAAIGISNDSKDGTPEERYEQVLAWVREQISKMAKMSDSASGPQGVTDKRPSAFCTCTLCTERSWGPKGHQFDYTHDWCGLCGPVHCIHNIHIGQEDADDRHKFYRLPPYGRWPWEPVT